MKRQILISVLLIPGFVSSQVAIQNFSLTTPDTNIVYVGIDNRIKISGLKDYSEIKLLIGGEIYGLDLEGIVVVRTAIIGKGSVELFHNSKLLLTREYNFQLLPRPKSSLALFTDTIISINTIRANPKVVVYLPDCVARVNYRVIAFKVDLVGKDGSNIESFDIHDDQIPSNILDLIGRLESGDKLHFYQLRVLGPDDERYSSFEIYIK